MPLLRPFLEKRFSPKHLRIAAISLILITVFLSYTPVFRADFLNWDDEGQLVNNLAVRSLSPENIREIFTTTPYKTYVPLSILSYALEYHFFEYNPFIYHLDNLLLHLAVTFLVFIFSLRLGLTILGAFATALLFGLHPMHVESVAWVTERKDVLYAFFYMLALYSYWRYLETAKKLPFILSVIFGLLSMLAKPMALSLPLVLVVCDWFYGRKWSLRVFFEKIPYVLYVVPLGWLTYSLYMRLPASSFSHAPLIWIWTFIFYLRKFLYPAMLIPVYEVPLWFSIINTDYFFPAAFFILILVCLVYYRRNRWLIFAFAFYFFSIFFLLRYDYGNDATFVADRFMYLPSVGFCVLFGAAVGNVFGWSSKRSKLVTGLVVLCLAVFFAVLGRQTFSQSKIWSKSYSLWEQQMRYHPNSFIALNNFATAYCDQEEYKNAVAKYKSLAAKDPFFVKSPDFKIIEKAVALYNRAVLINPYYADARYNLGNIYKDLGDFERAAALYQKTLRLSPDYKNAYYGLAFIYAKTGRPQEAIDNYQKILEKHSDNEDIYVALIKTYNELIEKEEKKVTAALYQKARDQMFLLYQKFVSSPPRRARSYFNLGTLYEEIKDAPQAIEYYQKAIAVNPNYFQAHYNLANVFDEIGERPQAIAHYQKSIMLNSRFEDNYVNLGFVYIGLKEYSRAIDILTKAIHLNPKAVDAYFNLGFAYQAAGQIEQAIGAYKKVVEIDPHHAEGYYNLGNAYVVSGKYRDAIDCYRQAMANKPNHEGALINLIILYVREKDFGRAVEYFEKARQLGYEVPENYVKILERYQAGRQD